MRVDICWTLCHTLTALEKTAIKKDFFYSRRGILCVFLKATECKKDPFFSAFLNSARTWHFSRLLAWNIATVSQGNTFLQQSPLRWVGQQRTPCCNRVKQFVIVQPFFVLFPPPDERWLSPNVGGNHVCIASDRDLAASIVQIEVILWLCQAIWNNAYAVLCLSSPMTAVTAWISMQADWPGRVRGLLADWSCCYLRSLRTRGPSDGRDGRVPEAAGDGRVRLPELAQWWWRGKPLTSASSMMVTNTNFNKFYTFFWWNLTWSYIELTLTLCCFLKSTLAAVRTGICAILVLVHDEGVSCDSSVYTWGYFCQREWGIFKKKKIQ